MPASRKRAGRSRSRRIVRTVVVLLSALVSLPTAALADRDIEYWSQIRITGAVSEAVAFTSTVALRNDEDATRHYYTRMESGLRWNISKHVALGAEYAHLNSRSGGRWALECRPSVSVTLGWNLGALRLSDRSRLERRVKESVASTRYRNQLTLRGSQVTPVRLRPYAAGEIFYDVSGGRLEKRRVSGGVTMGLWRPLAVSLYYMLEGRRPDSEWTDVGIFGTTLTYGF